ncbi:MAG TPA: lytic transglycosylase domain-containing protein [Campylobacterales bacterium]|nr:lytic transglycosylase domain-containing protein [Campylobacterales bacterium]
MSQRAILFLLFLSIGLSAETITLDFFKDKPRSFAKDFYISQFLDQDIKPKEAEALIGDVYNMNYRLFYKFADKVDNFSFTRTKYCLKLKAEQFKGKSNDCVAMGLSPYKATKLPPQTLSQIADDIKQNYPKISERYKIIATRSFETLMNAKEEVLISTFTEVGGKFRQTYYNHPLPASKLNDLSKQKSFSRMVVKIIRDPKLNNLQQSILKIDASNLSAEANFLLAMNAIKLQKEDIAIWYLKLSEKKSKKAFDKSKTQFWQYLLTQDKKHLSKLTESKDINIYSLFAYETLGIAPKGIITTIESNNTKAPFDITDPFAWVKVQKIFKSQKYSSYDVKKAVAMKLNSKESEAHVARLIYNFQKEEHYFLKPHFQYIKHLKPERIALILAIARQESRFIPASVSYSYALGMMQFMPYVAKDIAEKNGFKDFKYEDMFDPKTAYKFADIHLNYLENSLYHPLFIAYAYNGGIGFTKRNILQKEYFKAGKYEPFLSLEMVPNGQARHYGKKVLANYLIYAQLLGVDTSIKTLLNTLKPPHHMHRF